MQVTSDVATLLGEQKVDAIVCVAGGWAGGSCSSKGERTLFDIQTACFIFYSIYFITFIYLFIYLLNFLWNSGV